jgi:hypothetical protein
MAPTTLPVDCCRLHVRARAGRACAAPRRAAAAAAAPCARPAPRRASLRVRADAGASAAAPMTGTNESLMKTLGAAIEEVQTLPPSQRKDGFEGAAKTVKAALTALKAQGGVSMFNSYTGRTLRRNVRPPQRAAAAAAAARMLLRRKRRSLTHRRARLASRCPHCAAHVPDAHTHTPRARPHAQIMLGELRQVGVQQPEVIGVPSVRNDAAFLATVVGTTSVLALVLGQLPGDWGFFGMYLSGGISIAVLAVGSVAPGLLQLPINAFSNVFPDYRDRVLRHEAAHFLVGYLLGVPVVGYSLDLGKEHTDFLEARLERKIVGAQRLSEDEIDALAVVAMAGVAAEAMHFPEVVGQTADLVSLQRAMNRAVVPMASNAQQNVTRWAVWQAAVMLRANPGAYDALREAMARRAPVAECIALIEKAAAADKAAAAK